jgi:hypothetical protein
MRQRRAASYLAVVGPTVACCPLLLSRAATAHVPNVRVAEATGDPNTSGRNCEEGLRAIAEVTNGDQHDDIVSKCNRGQTAR